MKTTGWSVGVWRSIACVTTRCEAKDPSRSQSLQVRSVSFWSWQVWGARAALMLLLALPVSRGGDFVNLGFESADTSHVTPQGEGWAHDLVPGWEWNIGGQGYASDAFMYVNGGVINGSGFGLAMIMTPANAYGFPVVDKYGLYLAASDIPGLPGPSSVRQMGEVPSGTKSLQFLNYYWQDSTFAPHVLAQVSVNGSLLPLHNDLLSGNPLPQAPWDSIFIFESSADVSAYAGQQVSLEFTIPEQAMGLDDIKFSTLPIPEPSTWTLLAFGLGALICFRQRRKVVQPLDPSRSLSPQVRSVRCWSWPVWGARAVLILLLVLPAVRGGDFVNLDFEAANTANVTSSGEGWAHDLAPGWEWNIGGAGYASDSFMSVNPGIFGGDAGGLAALMTTANVYGFPVVGRYGIYLAGDSNPATLWPSSIRQTGDVPVGAKSLQFLDYYWFNSTFAPQALVQVRINGSLLPLHNYLLSVTSLQHAPNNSIFIFESTADVSAYAGKNVSLEFTVVNGDMGLDDIKFSTLPIPEPSTWALLGTGLGSLLWNRRRRSSGQVACPGRSLSPKVRSVSFRPWIMWRACAALFLFLALPVGRGSEFQNLDFESVNAQSLSDVTQWSAHSLAPSWQWNIGGRGYVSETGIYVNGAVLNGDGEGWAGIMTPGNFYGFPVVGQYGLYLASALFPDHFVPTSILQSGDVPLGSKSLQFLDYYWYGSTLQPEALVQVRINDVLIPLHNDLLSVKPLPGTGGGDSIFTFASSADVSSYAGQTVKLEFIIPQRDLGLDDIKFSTLPIPEPSTWTLLATGLSALVWLQQRRGPAAKDQNVVRL